MQLPDVSLHRTGCRGCYTVFAGAKASTAQHAEPSESIASLRNFNVVIFPFLVRVGGLL